jgi:hypothetical protein
VDIYADTVPQGPKGTARARRVARDAGRRLRGGQTRRNVALLLSRPGQLADARVYAEAALRDFESYGARATPEVEKTRGFLTEIGKRMKPA